MEDNTKTVGGSLLPEKPSNFDPLNSLKRESLDRMKAALLSTALDDPLSTVTAMRQITVMRAYHQVVRIVQYLDIMDKLEEALYNSIEREIETIEFSDSNLHSITKLLTIQEKLQKSIIESNKLLAPYLEMEQYPAFNEVESSTPVSANILEIDDMKREQLRESASSILSELAALPEPKVAEK